MTKSARMSSTEKAIFWAGHIEVWQGSGLSQGAYCRKHGLSKGSMSYWWTRRGKPAAKGSAPAVDIVPVPLQALRAACAPEEPFLVHVGNTFRIEIRGDFAVPVLEKLVRTLARL